MPRAADISPAGVYVLDSLLETTVWVGQHAAPSFLKALFGTETPRDGTPLLPAESTPEAAKLHALLDSMRSGRPLASPLHVVVQGSPEQQRFFGRLAADGYEPFVIHMHASRVQPRL